MAPSGTLVAVGFTTSGPDLNRDAYIATFAPDGTPGWHATFGGSGADDFDAVAIKDDGTIVAGGDTCSPDGDMPTKDGSTDCAGS